MAAIQAPVSDADRRAARRSHGGLLSAPGRPDAARRELPPCHIDQSKTEILEFGVQFKCANEIRREGQFVLVTGCRIEDLGNELAHRAPSLSQEVVDFGEHQSWHEDEARRRQS